MKALLQVGPAQLFVEGASFHLLCRDIQQSLETFVELRESDMSLELHVEALEMCLVTDAQRLRAAGVAVPKSLPDDDDDEDDGDATVAGCWSPAPRNTAARGTHHPVPRHVCPNDGQPRRPASRAGPLFVFSADSFDAAEALVQRLHARLLEQRLLLDDLELTALCSGGGGGAVPPTSRVVPLPLVRLDTYLSTPAAVLLPEYDIAGNRRRPSTTVGQRLR
ncbi:hypothetical protein NESM_000068800 [Novymonas esmeraldas]|uniref:Uncharacterized protein n=1 Tax=Novymonas esmeraldas TaxID=1808958 RepID=A0AAW0F3H1_9TRYP